MKNNLFRARWKFLGFLAAIALTLLSVMLYFRWQEARTYHIPAQSFYSLILLSLLLTLTGVLLVWWAGYALFLRLADLQHTIRRLAEGDLSARTRLPYGFSPLSQLARELDEMAARWQETQSLLDLIAGHAPLLVFALDREGRFTFSCGKALEKLGLKPDEVLGRSALEMYAAYPEIVDNLQKALAGEKRAYRSRLGDLVFYTLCFPLYDAKGELAGVSGLALDISELEQARQQVALQAMALQEASDAIFITNSEGIIQWVNRAFTQLTGYTPEEAIGQTPRLLKSGLYPEAHYRNLWNTIRSGQTWQSDMINRRKDGSLYEVLQVIIPVRDPEGNTWFLSIQRPVGEERRRERLNRAQAKLVEATTQPLELSPLMARILEAAMELTPWAEKGSILLLGPDQHLHIRAVHGYHDPRALLSTFPLTSGYAAKAFREQRPLLIPDVRADASIRYEGEITELAEIQSAIVAPLIAHGHSLGVLSLDNISHKEAFTQADLEMLSQFASQAALLIENVQLIHQTRHRLQQLEVLHTIDRAISSAFDIELIMKTVIPAARTYLGVEAAAIWLYQPALLELSFAFGEGFRSPPPRHIRAGRDLIGEVAIVQKALRIYRCEAEEQQILQRLFPLDEFRSACIEPLLAHGTFQGVLAIFHRQPEPYLSQEIEEPEWRMFLEMLAAQTAIALRNAWLFQEAQQASANLLLAYETTLEGWAKALEMRDAETHGHTRRVLDLTLRLAQALSVPAEELTHIRRGVLLHDIGKLAIPDEILRKPGPLTPQEWEIMRRHPQLAAEMLSEIEFLKPALAIPLYHHEKWDGTGYPFGLKGEQIPLPARIFAVVDVWDALTNDRPYHQALSQEEALAYIRSQAGTHFDPRIVEVFLTLIEAEGSRR
jgi:PAS domain S-box-containing protein